MSVRNKCKTSIEGVVHIEEEYPEEPDCYEDVVGCYPEILDVLA
jgi:hypothetical protein